MFREIRKKRNKIEDSAAEELLRNSRRGVLAVNGDDGYPYAIPLNYFYDRENRKIYFHGARAGIRSMLCGYVIRYVLRFMEMRRSGRKPGHRLCRVRLCSGDVI